MSITITIGTGVPPFPRRLGVEGTDGERATPWPDRASWRFHLGPIRSVATQFRGPKLSCTRTAWGGEGQGGVGRGGSAGEGGLQGDLGAGQGPRHRAVGLGVG